MFSDMFRFQEPLFIAYITVNLFIPFNLLQTSGY